MTVDFDRLGVRPGETVLDLGCGGGRHSFEMLRRGAQVVALDYDPDEVRGVVWQLEQGSSGEMDASACLPARGDAQRLPFPDACFDRIVAAEVLEHLPDDGSALDELVRVLKPGGAIAVTVPAWLPERICWALSNDYHAPAAVGGHVRIYSKSELETKLRVSGLELRGTARVHSLHSPYWWIRCAVGPTREDHPLVSPYKRFLEWDIVKAPTITRLTDRALNPVLGKSLVVYACRPAAVEATVA